MDFYHIKEDYIFFLRSYDGRIALNKGESRPYVGIVLQIGDIKYYVPFTSPKPKHQRMNNKTGAYCGQLSVTIKRRQACSSIFTII